MRARAFTLLEILVVATIIMLVTAISIPFVLSSKKSANEGNAVAGLKAISTQQALFHAKDKDGDDQPDYGTLDELLQAELIDQVLGSGTKSGYLFQAQPSATTPGELYYALATPILPEKTGDRFFFVNQTGVMYFATSPLAVDPATCDVPAGAIPVGE